LFVLTVDRVTGENEATVGGFGSATEIGAPSVSLAGFGEGDIESSQGVSWSGGQVNSVQEDLWCRRNIQWQPSTTSLLREAGVCDLIAGRCNGVHTRRSIPV
jgi:hypothetical protein